MPFARARGRGANLNPANRFEPIRLHVLGETLVREREEHPEGRQVQTKLHGDQTRSVINAVNSPDLAMQWTVNPYRGCEHGCIYCYARPGHEYFGLSCGLDFETKIFAKYDAPRLLREELASVRWRGETISMSGVTDCYQPLEAKLKITRGCLEVMAECKQPVFIVTKNALVTRDIDLLASLAKVHAAGVAVSVTTLDPDLASRMEPRASAPSARLRAIRELSQAGIPVTVMVAPIIPGLNDREIPAILRAASEAGATSAGHVLLRLPYQIKAIFLEWLQRHYPERASHVETLIRDTRDGALNSAEFGVRFRGVGPIAQAINTTFRVFCAKHNLNRSPGPLSSKHFERPQRDRAQLGLFGGAS